MYHRFGHLKEYPAVKIGDQVKRGQLLGYVGNTGNSTGAHLHYDVCKELHKLPYEYVQGMSKAKVAELYPDPSVYMKDELPCPNTLNTGWKYLQWTGSLYHPGIDINSPNDFGIPIKSPIDGRVMFIVSAKEPNHGWGNMLIIEEKNMPSTDVSFGLRLAGRFLLDVDNRGRLWYVDQNGKRYDVGITPDECSAFLRKMAGAKVPLGITSSDLNKIPLA